MGTFTKKIIFLLNEGVKKSGEKGKNSVNRPRKDDRQKPIATYLSIQYFPFATYLS